MNTIEFLCDKCWAQCFGIPIPIGTEYSCAPCFKDSVLRARLADGDEDVIG